MTWENENILLRRFASTGDAGAFSEIVRRHAGLVYGACLRVLADRNKAADAAQETFFQLLRSAGQITGSLPSWLHRVATRKAIDVIRSDSRRRQREVEYAAKKLRKAEKWRDISRYVDEALDELDEQTRGILIQRFFEGRSTTEIAADIGLSQPTVFRRIESGVAQLREKLRKRGIIVAAAILVSLLSENAAQAVPVLLLRELGKMALVGGKAATATVGAAASASSAAATAAVGGALAGVKAKIITAAAVAAVGVGGVVTYKHLTQPVEQPQPKAATNNLPRQRPPRHIPTSLEPRGVMDIAEAPNDISAPYSGSKEQALGKEKVQFR